MILEMERDALLRVLGHVTSVVERRTTIPILSNVLLKASGSSLYCKATDLEREVSDAAPGHVSQPGAVTVAAHVLYDIVRKLAEGSEVAIAREVDKERLTVRAGHSIFTLQTLAAEDFPDLAAGEFSHTFKMPAKDLQRLIDKTRFAISTEETRYYLNGIYLHLAARGKQATLRAVATDGHRLAHIEKTGEQFDVPGENKTLIPKKAMGELYSLLQNSDVDQVEFAKDDATLFFRIGERLLTSRQLTGQFPNYEAVLPRETSKSVVVRGADLNTAIQRVAQFADERSRAIRLKLDKNELKISSSSTEAGESEDSIETSYTADAMTIGFNSEYLIDFLKAQSAGEVRLEFKDAQSAGQMRPEDGSDDGFKYRYVVMPMRI